MIRRPPRSTQGVSSAASDVYKRQPLWGGRAHRKGGGGMDEQQFDAFGMFRCAPAPLAVVCGFALYDEDTTTHGTHKHIQTRNHTPCAVSFSPSAGRKGAAAGGTASVSVRQQKQALRHRASRQVQPVVARLTTRTLRHMHRHIQTRTHTACAVSISPSGGRKGAATGGTASVSVRQQEQALRHRAIASRQVQPVVARLTTRTQPHMHRHIQTHTHTACAMSFSL